MAQIYHNITELIGNTPIVKLNKLVPEGAADVYVKLEAFNPGSSVKDRIALSMIETAEQEGLIQPSATIVEATSGNTESVCLGSVLLKVIRSLLLCQKP